MASDVELSKVFSQALVNHIDHRERRVVCVNKEENEKGIGSLLGLFSCPKLYILVWFYPLEHKPYQLDYLIDSRCHMNLSKGNAIPSFYW